MMMMVTMMTPANHDDVDVDGGNFTTKEAREYNGAESCEVCCCTCDTGNMGRGEGDDDGGWPQ